MNPAKSARLAKEAHPERYCHVKNCLWRVYPDKPCGKHGTPVVRDDDIEEGVNLCLRCHVNEPMPEKMLCTDCAADRKPEKGSDEWYEMMDNPKSAWRAGE